MPPAKMSIERRQSRDTQGSRFRPYPIPFHLNSLDSQRRDAQARFQEKYGVCNADSVFHDLKCGHRIQAERHDTNCGANCVAPQYGRPFACQQCIVAEVEMEMTLQGLRISVDKTTTTTREQIDRDAKILSIADEKIAAACGRGERMCTAAEKFESPTLQFFDTFLREEGFEGIDPSEAKTAVEPETARTTDKQARRFTTSASGTWKKRKTTNFHPALFLPFGNSGTDYIGHGKIATPPSASSQLIAVHKRRKTVTNKPDPFQPRNQLRDPSWRDRMRAEGNTAHKQPQDVNMANAGPFSTSVLTASAGDVDMTGTGPSSNFMPTSTSATPAVTEDDATKAVRLAMAAVVLDQRSGVDSS